jgi:hypothetical protein
LAIYVLVLFEGKSFHKSIPTMIVSYAFFIGGNKRIKKLLGDSTITACCASSDGRVKVPVSINSTGGSCARDCRRYGTLSVLLDSGSTPIRLEVLQGSALCAPLIKMARISGSSGAAKRTAILSRKRPRFVRKGLSPIRHVERVIGFHEHADPPRGFAGVCPMCALDQDGTNIRVIGSREAHGDPFAQVFPVRAQGIGGARRNGSSLSGRVKEKIPCKAWDFFLDVTEPPQSPVFCGTPQKMRPKITGHPPLIILYLIRFFEAHLAQRVPRIMRRRVQDARHSFISSKRQFTDRKGPRISAKRPKNEHDSWTRYQGRPGKSMVCGDWLAVTVSCAA